MTPHLAPVPDDGPFLYPVPKSARLDGNGFVKWHYHRWLGSETYLMASLSVKGALRDLFDLAQTQSPPGTLPQDRVQIARMLRIDTIQFEGLCREVYGLLRGWKPCIADDGEGRLYHAVVLEQVLDALERREISALSKEDKAEYQRLKRLREALTDMGCNKAVVGDEVLIGRMNEWLKQNWRGRRTQAAYDAVMLQANREKWLGGSANMF